MTRVLFALVSVVFWISSPVHAEIVEVPLSDLHGAYAEGGTIVRTAAFELAYPPTVIRGAWIRVSGDATGGTTECEGGVTSPWPFDFSASMSDIATGGVWLAGGWTSGEPGPFLVSDGFSPILGASWEFLRDGTGEVVLYGTPSPLVGLCWPVTLPPEAVVGEAALIIDADFAVPNEATTWGRVKAFYDD